jgi:DNA topoisomerase I
MQKKVEGGTLRIKTKDLQVYEKTRLSWKKSKKQLPNTLKIIKLFKDHNNLRSLIDKKDPRFLKGQFNKSPQGARINILPNNKKLDKAYSLFAEDLTIHDESSHGHWDVIYKNPSGSYAYVYTLEKKLKAKTHKYNVEKEFEKYYPKLKINIEKALNNKEDNLALPMYTLLKTYMRVGSEIYYISHKHQGLTTLKKKDITIDKNKVTFKYKAKDGVPLELSENFPKNYIKRLKQNIKPLKDNEFIFTNPNTNHPYSDIHLKKAFKQYCGKEFYPHIVRSYYATKTTRDFLNKNKTATKDDINELFTNIAAKLGHRKYVKKEHTWKNNPTMTMNFYVNPELVEKTKLLIN